MSFSDWIKGEDVVDLDLLKEKYHFAVQLFTGTITTVLAHQDSVGTNQFKKDPSKKTIQKVEELSLKTWEVAEEHGVTLLGELLSGRIDLTAKTFNAPGYLPSLSASIAMFYLEATRLKGKNINTHLISMVDLALAKVAYSTAIFDAGTHLGAEKINFTKERTGLGTKGKRDRRAPVHQAIVETYFKIEGKKQLKNYPLARRIRVHLPLPEEKRPTLETIVRHLREERLVK
ncbi:hypothetical protein DSCW_02540 [Desulfosarcina widdelii]|uniref:Uncharacterized protein n=1 Tax=Desulfosarcina widdelii TaxID=947919 RepID=A0A5K7Z8N9_9BACT|nr:hypothetical protein [Desulfosarcina widdelii]BBO72837.1 hypothetical protein DSCW_02540 [Desulfosarcina widdelii]